MLLLLMLSLLLSLQLVMPSIVYVVALECLVSFPISASGLDLGEDQEPGGRMHLKERRMGKNTLGQERKQFVLV